MTRAGQLTPSTARPITIPVGDSHIAALRSGADGSPDVLLLPGYTGSKEDFAPLFDPLTDAGFCVTAIDLPGQYESPGPDTASAYTASILGAAVRAIARASTAAVHLVGHSFGGLVARAAAIDEPGLFADVVLMSSGPAAIAGLRRDRIEALSLVLPSAGLSGVYAAMQNALADETGYVPPPTDLAEFLEKRFLAGNPAMLHGMGDTLLHEPDRVLELAGTRLRLLVLHGEHDDAWPPSVQAAMAEQLGAAHAVVPLAAHSPSVENTLTTVAALVSFWRGGA